MKRTLTAVIALAAAAGFAGMAQAQSTTANTTASPAAQAPASAPATAPAPQAQANPAGTPGAAPANPAMAPQGAAPQANAQQPAGSNNFWSRNITQDEVRQAQQQLKAQGLYNGPIDGMSGTEMQKALARYQQQNGLRQTATLDEPTMGRLGGGMNPASGVTAPPASSPTVGAATPPAGSRPAVGATTPPAGSTAATAGTTAPPAGTAAPAAAGGTTSSAPAPTTTTQPMTR